MLSQIENRFHFLVSRRRDAIDRHRTLRAAIEWSFRLLPPELQRFFAQLSVFQGGWTVERAQAVCSEPLALECLAQLREHSLVLAEESEQGMRFRMLETLREYAAEQLAEEERAACRRLHADHYLALAEQEDSQPQRDDSKMLLYTDYDNVRAAFEWYDARPDGAESGLRLACAVWRSWGGPYHQEGRVWLAKLLEKEGVPMPLRAKALNMAGILAQVSGDYAAACAYYERSLAIRRELDDRPGVAKVLGNMAFPVLCLGDHVRAASLYEESRLLSTQLQRKDGIASALRGLGLAAFYGGDYPQARSHLEQSLALRREIGTKANISVLHGNLGQVACAEGDYAAARSFFEQAHAMASSQGSFNFGGLCGLAEVSRCEGSLPAARAQYRHLLRLLDPEAYPNTILWPYFLLERYAAVLETQGLAQPAAQLCAAAEAQREALGIIQSPVAHLAFLDRLLPALRDRLGAAAFSAAWLQGRQRTLKQAIALAIQEGE